MRPDKKFYPVIHCISLENGGVGHTLFNARIATENGADGVFLIGHNLHSSDLLYIYDQLRKQHPSLWIGVNFLDISVITEVSRLEQACRSCNSLNAIWTDHMPNVRLNLPQSVQIFAGVAFKYINPDQNGADLKKSCERAITFATVATTSGRATGEAPDFEKLKEIRKHLSFGFPLAIASGVSIQNIGSLAAWTDYFLVASSISKKDPTRGGYEYLIPECVRELADLIHSPLLHFASLNNDD